MHTHVKRHIYINNIPMHGLIVDKHYASEHVLLKLQIFKKNWHEVCFSKCAQEIYSEQR